MHVRGLFGGVESIPLADCGDRDQVIPLKDTGFDAFHPHKRKNTFESNHILFELPLSR
jgi:hypothetical protein